MKAYEDFVYKMGTGRITVYGSVYRMMMLAPSEDAVDFIVALVVDDRDSHRKVKRMRPAGSTVMELDEEIIDVLFNSRKKNAPRDENAMTRIKHYA